MYYVYILRCSGDKLYTGVSTDVNRRFSEHTGDKVGGAKFTKARKPERIEAVWQTDSRASAQRIEYRIKQLSREKKDMLISGNSDIFTLIGEIEGITAERVLDF